ncbi:MAG: methylmalonyl-CoA mutase family protein [Thermodesulfobacteriota bacterium]|nr:methylmalonyl-CoA mutase family protein [Thermodesulfobacteriota bacterium]
MSSLDRVHKAEEQWRQTCLGEKPVPEEKSTSGIHLKVIYTPGDVQNIDFLEKVGFPGDYPFTRGVYPSMYRGNLWSMRQYAGFATPEETNRRYKNLLAQGQPGLSVAFDLPTQCGYDSDDPLIEEEVGKVGVAVDTLQDMEIIFDGIPLDQITTSFTINPTAAILLAMYIAVAEKQGVPVDKIGGTLQNDILKEYLARGTQIFPPRPSLRLIADIIEYCKNHVPKMNTISISGYHVREAGANAIQEVAYCLSSAIVYVEEVLKRGIGIDEFAPRLSFIFACGPDLFEEVAKFRAARQLWARIAKERFGAQDPRSMMLRFFAGTMASCYTAREPLNNLIRGTICALAGVLGGVNSLHVTGYDEAYATPTEESSRLGLRIQQILAFETGIPKVVDPLGGSYYVESLTEGMGQEITKAMDQIEQDGGMLACIEKGKIQQAILQQAYETEQIVQKGKIVRVGENKFRSQEGREPDLILQKADPEVLRHQVERLRRVKAARDEKKVQKTLGRVKEAASAGENLLPALIQAVKAYATNGEMVATLKEVFGEYRELGSV